jgi:hypothetical protein
MTIKTNDADDGMFSVELTDSTNDILTVAYDTQAFEDTPEGMVIGEPYFFFEICGNIVNATIDDAASLRDWLNTQLAKTGR